MLNPSSESLWELFLHVASGVPSALIVGVVAFMSRSLVQNMLRRWLSKYKAGLDRDLQDHLLERKRQHDADLAELRVRFAHLHDKRVDCIMSIHQKLLSMLWSLERISNPAAATDEQFQNDQLGVFLAARNDMDTAFNVNRILLPRSLADNVRCIVLEMVDIAETIRMEPQAASRQFAKLTETVKPRLEKLADEFRQMLGVGGSGDKA